MWMWAPKYFPPRGWKPLFGPVIRRLTAEKANGSAIQTRVGAQTIGGMLCDETRRSRRERGCPFSKERRVAAMPRLPAQYSRALKQAGNLELHGEQLSCERQMACMWACARVRVCVWGRAGQEGARRGKRGHRDEASQRPAPSVQRQQAAAAGSGSSHAHRHRSP